MVKVYRIFSIKQDQVVCIREEKDYGFGFKQLSFPSKKAAKLYAKNREDLKEFFIRKVKRK